jgi:hypothetical protein
MWLEICLSVIAFSHVVSVMIGLAKYYKEWVEVVEEEEMTEEAKRMFN